MPAIVRRISVATLILILIFAVGWVAVTAHRIESIAFWRDTDAASAYRAARKYLESAEAARGACNFSPQAETVVERWGPGRWRVAGSVDTQPAPGSRVHTLYSCVLHYNGRDRWEVEDLQFERLE